MNQRIQKQNIREKYWRYSLYVILLGLGTVIFVELIPFLGGLLGALTIYVLLRGQMRALTIRHKLRRSLAASLLIGEAIVCFLIPLSLLVWLLVAKLQDVTTQFLNGIFYIFFPTHQIITHKRLFQVSK